MGWKGSKMRRYERGWSIGRDIRRHPRHRDRHEVVRVNPIGRISFVLLDPIKLYPGGREIIFFNCPSGGPTRKEKNPQPR